MKRVIKSSTYDNYKNTFIRINNKYRETITYRVNYTDMNDATMVKFNIHRIGEGGTEDYFWAMNRGRGVYTTKIMKDVKEVDTIRTKINPNKHFNIGRFFREIVEELEYRNQSLQVADNRTRNYHANKKPISDVEFI